MVLFYTYPILIHKLLQYFSFIVRIHSLTILQSNYSYIIENRSDIKLFCFIANEILCSWSETRDRGILDAYVSHDIRKRSKINAEVRKSEFAEPCVAAVLRLSPQVLA